MWIRTQAFHVPKQGHAETEYEDAFFPEAGFAGRDLTEFRCAVADGASESAFAGLWAQLLVRAFGRRRLHLDRLRRLWQQAVVARPLPWYLERKVQHGAHAAFLGLVLRGAADPDGNGSWRAIAVGDCCLFHLRGGRLLAVGPLCRADQFDNVPDLLSSRSRRRLGRRSAGVNLLSGRWERGDMFLLATDALAQWMLARHESGAAPWPELAGLDAADHRGFAQLVGDLRGGDDLHNDDTTLLRVGVDA